jgi:hypothetical protein
MGSYLVLTGQSPTQWHVALWKDRIMGVRTPSAGRAACAEAIVEYRTTAMRNSLYLSVRCSKAGRNAANCGHVRWLRIARLRVPNATARRKSSTNTIESGVFAAEGTNGQTTASKIIKTCNSWYKPHLPVALSHHRCSLPVSGPCSLHGKGQQGQATRRCLAQACNSIITLCTVIFWPPVLCACSAVIQTKGPTGPSKTPSELTRMVPWHSFRTIDKC